jgi:hypothetical protein
MIDHPVHGHHPRITAGQTIQNCISAGGGPKNLSSKAPGATPAVEFIRCHVLQKRVNL